MIEMRDCIIDNWHRLLIDNMLIYFCEIRLVGALIKVIGKWHRNNTFSFIWNVAKALTGSYYIYIIPFWISVVIVCCFMRIRIPRTKRQIDLIAARRKMRKSTLSAERSPGYPYCHVQVYFYARISFCSKSSFYVAVSNFYIFWNIIWIFEKNCTPSLLSSVDWVVSNFI